MKVTSTTPPAVPCSDSLCKGRADDNYEYFYYSRYNPHYFLQCSKELISLLSSLLAIECRIQRTMQPMLVQPKRRMCLHNSQQPPPSNAQTNNPKREETSVETLLTQATHTNTSLVSTVQLLDVSLPPKDYYSTRNGTLVSTNDSTRLQSTKLLNPQIKKKTLNFLILFFNLL